MSILKVILLSMMMFAGNSNIFKLVNLEDSYYMPTSILLNIIYLGMIKINTEVLKIILLLIFLSYFLIINLVSLQSFELAYLIWPLNTFFLTLFFSEFLQKIKLDPSKAIYFAIFPIFLFMGSILVGLERSSFIFGPNVMYRIYIIFGAILFLYSNKQHYKFLGVIIAFLGASTGSRGFTISIAIFMLFVVLDLFTSFKRRRTNIMLFALSFLAINYFLTSFANERIFFFSSASYSTGLRLDLVITVIQNYEFYFRPFGLSPEELSLIFGYGDRLTYPHNFLIESFLYYGFIGFTLTSILSILALFSAKDLKSLCILLLLFVFCSVSGDFGDNYVYIAFAFAMILNRNINNEENRLGVK